MSYFCHKYLSSLLTQFKAGFQVLHAVHAVETFLAKLKQRGCNFHILWFEDHEYLGVPARQEQAAYKWYLTRAVIIQHLAHPSSIKGGDYTLSHRFSSSDSDTFRHYLAETPLHFVLCSYGGVTEAERSSVVLGRLGFGYEMSSAGYCVGFIDEIDFQSSKVHSIFQNHHPTYISCLTTSTGLHIRSLIVRQIAVLEPK